MSSRMRLVAREEEDASVQEVIEVSLADENNQRIVEAEFNYESETSNQVLRIVPSCEESREVLVRSSILRRELRDVHLAAESADSTSLRNQPPSAVIKEGGSDDTNSETEEESYSGHAKLTICKDNMPLRVATLFDMAESEFHRRMEKPLLQPGQSSDKHRTISLLCLPVASLSGEFDAGKETAPSHPLRPIDLLSVERGQAIILEKESEKRATVVTAQRANNRGLPLCCYTKRKIAPLAISDAKAGTSQEVGFLGKSWRRFLKQLLLSTLDETNLLRISRPMQLSLSFLTAHESYIASQLIEAFERGQKSGIETALSVAFQNRNVSRLVVQTVLDRHDFLWHWSTAIRWNRVFDAIGQLPAVGITRFPATENFPSTRDHALASIFRILLGQGNWITRVITQGRESLITDNPKAVAQNLAAESNGFELANRNQYGTYFGRRKTNEFRAAHRLPTDESIVRTFVAQPQQTLVNNGVVHVLRQLAKHWDNMLQQEFGNFAHQRMEQLDPFETIRFHIPEVLQVVTSLRGRNCWDSRILAPVIKEMQELKQQTSVTHARSLIQRLEGTIVSDACSGIPSILDPFLDWLNAIGRALDEVEQEVQGVFKIITSVDLGIRMGYDIMKDTKWRLPKDGVLRQSILDYIRGHRDSASSSVNLDAIEKALNRTTPRDRRTLLELMEQDLVETKPGKLLLSRVKTLLQREMRRHFLSATIKDLSKGDKIETARNMSPEDWYWVEGKRIGSGAYVLLTVADPFAGNLKLLHVNSGKTVKLNFDKISVFRYIPIAEAISRAQRAFMTIEVEYGRRFAYTAFMEFSWLRTSLRRLTVVSQMTCDSLDLARLNILSELKRSKPMEVCISNLQAAETYYVEDETAAFVPFSMHSNGHPIEKSVDELRGRKILRILPQSVLVVGGGPTGLMTTIHCAEACIANGGRMKLYEARDGFQKGGASFERAQIVRLDARWIATLRYHLGTGFEDVFIPAAGETNSQLGNTLPMQGFVEITIKDLESMLHHMVARLWARGIIELYTDSRAQYDVTLDALVKLGKFLKVGDRVLRPLEASLPDKLSWEVCELEYIESLGIDELKVGQVYGIFVQSTKSIELFKLEQVELVSKLYHFYPIDESLEVLSVGARNLPCVYAASTKENAHARVKYIVLQLKNGAKGQQGKVIRLPWDEVSDSKFVLDLGQTHVVEAIGKPSNTDAHFLATTTEPYAVCCIQGLKVSMLMHNFGEKRFGAGILDDFRSVNDQNTRIISDFTKMIRVLPIVRGMLDRIHHDEDWKLHFSDMLDKGSEVQAMKTLLAGFENLYRKSSNFRRQTLQTRFFETGDNYYLGMEMLREYSQWKRSLVDELIQFGPDDEGSCKTALEGGFDRIWYESCLDVIRQGDVYNPGARGRVPSIRLIDSKQTEQLGELPIAESFQLLNEHVRYEVLLTTHDEVLTRSVDGRLSWMDKQTLVHRGCNLTRSPDGKSESKVAISTFLVGHYVNHRSMRKSSQQNNYVLAFAGDSQSTPHFMRYSGLTGACINATSINTFLERAAEQSLVARLRTFSKETNWSNGEVVQRGTGGNYGEDGFLRPGFSYCAIVDYLFSKSIEYAESNQDTCLLSRDWQVKIGASLIPRGLESNKVFLVKLRSNLQHTIFEKVLSLLEHDGNQDLKYLSSVLKTRKRETHMRPSEVCTNAYWENLLVGIDIDECVLSIACSNYIIHGQRVAGALETLISTTRKAQLYGLRISSELYKQPKSVDSLVDDFAVEAQNFANSLVQASALAAGALAFRLVDETLANTLSACLGGLNIAVSFATMTNVSRYKVRNEEARILYKDEKFHLLKEKLFERLPRAKKSLVAANPFLIRLDTAVSEFLDLASYYDYGDTSELRESFDSIRLDPSNEDKIHAFRQALLQKFIPCSYHVNSYIQEALVRVYQVADDMSIALSSDSPISTSPVQIETLYQYVVRLESSLEYSCQRGAVRWGFLKERELCHWDIVVCLKCLCYFVSCRLWSPMGVKIKVVLRQLQACCRSDNFLQRELIDLEQAYWASRESDTASLIFVSAFLTFSSSITFTLARVFSISSLEVASFWAMLPSAIGSLIATGHFARKGRILMQLFTNLRRGRRQLSNATDANSSLQIQFVVIIQFVFTAVRLFTAITAATALPLALSIKGLQTTAFPLELPLWIATVSIISAAIATLGFFFVEYSVRYNLPTKLGPSLGDLFEREIDATHAAVKTARLSSASIDTEEREAWEYTARSFLHEYRFDTVFAADRFGQLLQYLQSGMSRHSHHVTTERKNRH